jgi:hypothetical protein
VGVGGAMGSRTAFFGAGPAGVDRCSGRASSVAQAGPRPWQRQRPRATARPRAAGWPARPARPASPPAGRSRAPTARRAVLGPVPAAAQGEPSCALVARSQCGVDVVPGICHAAARGCFLASDVHGPHPNPSPRGRL